MHLERLHTLPETQVEGSIQILGICPSSALDPILQYFKLIAPISATVECLLALRVLPCIT